MKPNKIMLLVTFGFLVILVKSQTFEGILKYKMQIGNNSQMPDSIVNMMMQGADTEQWLYYSNGNYKTITNVGKIVNLHNNKDSGIIYIYSEEYPEDASAIDYTIEQKEELTITESEISDTILNFPCRLVSYIYTSSAGAKTRIDYYYTSQIVIDSLKFSKFNQGMVEVFFKDFGTIPLKYTIKGDGLFYSLQFTAFEIIKKEIKKEEFEIPETKN